MTAFRVIGVTVQNDIRIEEKGPLVYVSVTEPSSREGYGWDMRPGDALTMAEMLKRIATEAMNHTAMRNG